MPEEIVVIIVLGMVMVTSLGFGIMRTIGRHLERKYGSQVENHTLRAELDEVKAQLESMNDLKTQVIDMEERLDFAERVIARQGEGGRLPPPS